MTKFFLFAKAKIFFTIILILSVLILSSVVVFGEESKKITEIHIVTPDWQDQTNKDGSGLFFELIRKIYEPCGLKMTYEIMPWKRAEDMINKKHADAMLCARNRKGRLTTKYPMFVEYTAVVFKKDNIKKWEGINTLNKKKVIWIRGYDFHKDKKLKHLKMKWHELNSHKQAWTLIDADRYDFYIDALIDMEMYIKNNIKDMTPYQIEILWSENTYMSFAKTERSDKLIKIFDKKIIELFKSGELEKLFKKWNTRFSPAAWESN